MTTSRVDSQSASAAPSEQDTSSIDQAFPVAESDVIYTTGVAPPAYESMSSAELTACDKVDSKSSHT